LRLKAPARGMDYYTRSSIFVNCIARRVGIRTVQSQIARSAGKLLVAQFVNLAR